MKRITKRQLQELENGQTITGEGLEVRRTGKGLVYYAASQVHGRRIRDKLGAEWEGMNLTKARKKLTELRAAVPGSIDVEIEKPNIAFKDAAEFYVHRHFPSDLPSDVKMA